MIWLVSRNISLEQGQYDKDIFVVDSVICLLSKYYGLSKRTTKYMHGEKKITLEN